jgi:hypothetical protein
MSKDFIPHQEALELKELGFDEPCFGFYIASQLVVTSDTVYNSSDIPVCKAPLYQQAFRWFREKYQIDSWIYPNLNGLYSVSIVRRGVGLGKVSEYQTYPEAELDCLKKLIQIVKNKGGDK